MWLMRQRPFDTGWQRCGILVQNGRAYYARLYPNPALLGAECAECHPNGPRALRGQLRAGTEGTRNAINVFVWNTGLLQPYFTPSEPAPIETANRLNLAPCVNCHDGIERTALSMANYRAITFQMMHGYMPPDAELERGQRHAIVEWLGRYEIGRSPTQPGVH